MLLARVGRVDPGIGGKHSTATLDRMTKSAPATTPQPQAQPQAQAQTAPDVDVTDGPGATSDTAAAAVPSPRDAVGGWLSGPQLEPGQDEWNYKGERLGLPESGAGALASQGRRLGALVVDWAIAYLGTVAFGWHGGTAQEQWGVIALFAAQMLLLESLLGYTIGKRIFGIRVGRLGGPLTPLHVIARTLLLLLVIPAGIWDRDGRGMHDRLAGTVVVNIR